MKENFKSLNLHEGDELLIIDKKDSIYTAIPEELHTIRVVKEYPYFIQVEGIMHHYDGDAIIPFSINKADIYCGSTIVKKKHGNQLFVSTK